jgi:hypothetical protein
MLRELPYMKASLSLERNTHIDKIYERAKQIKSQNIQFASKGFNRRGNIFDLN